MEKTTTQKIRLALFVITGLLIFIMAVYFIGNKQQMFGKTDHIKAVFNNVNGLQLGNSVRYSGINAGTVRGIQMVNDTSIRVDMLIDESILPHIKKDAVATISSDGLVGNMIINIIPGLGSAESVKPGDELRSQNRIRTEDLLKTLSMTNENAATLSENLLKITNDIIKGNGTLGLLLNDTIMAKDLQKTIHYLKISGEGTAESVAKLNQILASLDNKNNLIGVINDPAVANNMRTIVQNLEQTSTEINKVVTNLNATILNVKEGKGALNYLSNDPKLVHKIDSTMSNVKESSARLNENLEAMKHNFLFRGYFRKQEKARKK